MRLKAKCIATVLMTFIALFSKAEKGFPHMMSPDTMIAGETNIIQFIFSPPTSDQVLALITPNTIIDWNQCSDCMEDSLWANEVTKVSDTVYTATFDIPLGLYPTRYTLMVREANGSHIQYSDFMEIVSPPYITGQPEDSEVCTNDSAIFSVKVYEPDRLQYQWYHNDHALEGQTWRILDFSPVQTVDTGLYYCILSNYFGTDTTEKAQLDLLYYAGEIGLPRGPERFCRGTGNTTYYLPSNPIMDDYNWKLSPVSAGILDPGDTSVTVHWYEDFSGIAALYAETRIGSCWGVTSDTAEIMIAGPSQVPEICIVGLDEETGKYRIVWNKIPDESIVAYNIYRETNQAGIYLKLKTVPAGDFSVIVDSSSVPAEVTHLYRLSYTDTCGLESGFSPFHSTIHLSANAGTSGENNLNWSPYNGFAFLTYEIYRGVHPDTLNPLQEVSSNALSFTDLNPPGGNVYYQIVVSRDGMCQPDNKSGTDYSIAKSNIVEFNAVGTGQEISNRSLDIFPNPAQHSVNISHTGDPYEKAFLSICNLTGKVMAVYQLENGIITIPTDDLSDGIYFVQMKTDKNSIVMKLIIKR